MPVTESRSGHHDHKGLGQVRIVGDSAAVYSVSDLRGQREALQSAIVIAALTLIDALPHCQ